MKKIIFVLLFINGLLPIFTQNGLEFFQLNTINAQNQDGEFPEPITITGWIDPNQDRDNLDPLSPDLSGFDIDPISPNIAFPDLSSYSDIDFSDWRGENDEEIDNSNYFDEDVINGYDDENQENNYQDQEQYQEYSQIMSDITLMAKILEHRMKQVYGNNIFSFPKIVFDPKYSGNGYGKYSNGKITIPPKFFTLSDGDQASTLLHEYTHFTHDKNGINPISSTMKDAQGNIIPIITGTLTIVSNAEKASIRNEFLKICPSCLETTVNADIESQSKSIYKYICSNYWKEEIFVRKAELKGESDKMYELSEKYRNQLLDWIEKANWEYQRSLDYEEKNGIKNDGN